jgi:S-adenosylmethionine synthetase
MELTRLLKQRRKYDLGDLDAIGAGDQGMMFGLHP